MLLTDYFRSEKDITWDYAKQCGVDHGVIRLPEDEAFDLTDRGCWNMVISRFKEHGITPVVIEPMPNRVHDHIKLGDEKREESIEQVIKMMEIMDSFDIRTICFNFMAQTGWFRTRNDIPERGGALVTGFCMQDFEADRAGKTGTDSDHKYITEKELWSNYEYFVKTVIPYAEKYHIRLALHPDDPPVSPLGRVSRIMTSYENIRKAVELAGSDQLGITMCQACFQVMGEDLHRIIPEMKDKIFFIHFRNVIGNKDSFRETFHDNGSIDMAEMIRMYLQYGIDVPIRVDHVPAMAGETEKTGYSALGRLYAIGYLKGLLQATESERIYTAGKDWKRNV